MYVFKILWILCNLYAAAMSWATSNETEKCALKSEFRIGEPAPIVSGTCNGRGRKIDIVLTNRTEEPMISICFNDTIAEATYTENVIRGTEFGAVVQGRGSCDFHLATKNSYPSNMKIDTCCYPKKEQQKTLTILLQSSALAEKYVELASGSDMYMARGHLTPNSDGVTMQEKESTFYYENAVPQWQIINAGNWLDLETASRGYAIKHKVTLKVYTGAWGVGTLKDKDGKDVEIYLGKNSTGALLKNVLPMPRFMWKIMMDPVEKTGVAFVTINNPYEENHSPADYAFCKDVCNTQEWIGKFISNLKDTKKGYTQCCTVEDLYKKVKSQAPNLGNLPLLKY